MWIKREKASVGVDFEARNDFSNLQSRNTKLRRRDAAPSASFFLYFYFQNKNGAEGEIWILKGLERVEKKRGEEEETGGGMNEYTGKKK